jgi:hypothetical protein
MVTRPPTSRRLLFHPVGEIEGAPGRFAAAEAPGGRMQNLSSPRVRERRRSMMLRRNETIVSPRQRRVSRAGAPTVVIPFFIDGKLSGEQFLVCEIERQRAAPAETLRSASGTWGARQQLPLNALVDLIEVYGGALGRMGDARDLGGGGRSPCCRCAGGCMSNDRRESCDGCTRLLMLVFLEAIVGWSIPKAQNGCEQCCWKWAWRKKPATIRGGTLGSQMSCTLIYSRYSWVLGTNGRCLRSWRSIGLIDKRAVKRLWRVLSRGDWESTLKEHVRLAYFRFYNPTRSIN